MFTSGSTGEPKGVMVSNRALSNYLQWALSYYSNKRRLTFPLYTSIGFDLTITSLYVPLISGGKIVVYPESSGDVDTGILNVIRDNRVNIIKLTPAHLSILTEVDLSNSQIKQLIVGGDDLKRDTSHTVQSRFPQAVAIHNEYGPTEATVGCMIHTFDKTADTSGSVPIGYPVAGMSARVVNQEGVSQPAGVVGELWLSGPSLAEGYWEQTHETARRFFVDPVTGKKTYRTGDRVQANDKGELVYLGRQDNQIKINGHRIELSEIESACLKVGGVSDCTAVAHTSSSDFPLHTESGAATKPRQNCAICGLASDYPSIRFNDQGICHLCERFNKYKHRANQYFKSSSELVSICEKLKSSSNSKYDCIVLLSGGKDSSYMLARLADLSLSILAFTLDNGYISEGAKENIRKICKALGIDHVFGQTPAMPLIFKDSLERHSNVCHGCFKTLYTLSLKEAEKHGVDAIFTGLSRGQFFETRLTEELFTQPDFNIDEVDNIVLNARKTYHITPDAVSANISVDHITQGSVLDRIQFIDFYRYCDVNLDEMLDYLENRLPWVRPQDTGRSTNCLINDVGIYVHKRERGYHNYSLPYSWDVRLGHKQRDEALDELNDEIDENQVKKILKEIDYTPTIQTKQDQTKIAIYYTANESMSATTLRSKMKGHLPSVALPSHFVQLESLPLNKNGKVDKSALPNPVNKRDTENLVLPTNATEAQIAELWEMLLDKKPIDINENFFELGGDSLLAIKLVSRINKQGFNYAVSDLFTYPTVKSLAALSREPSENNVPDDSVEPFSQVDQTQLNKLAELMGKNL